MKIKVFAVTPASLNIRHPVDGKLNEAGSMWENDSFTARMLADNAVSEDQPKAVKSDDKPADKPNYPGTEPTGTRQNQSLT